MHVAAKHALVFWQRCLTRAPAMAAHGRPLHLGSSHPWASWRGCWYGSKDPLLPLGVGWPPLASPALPWEAGAQACQGPNLTAGAYWPGILWRPYFH